MKDTLYYDDLLHRYLDGDCSREEMEALMAYLAMDDSRKSLLRKLQDEYAEMAPAGNSIDPARAAFIRQELMHKIAPPAAARVFRWQRLLPVAAASLFLLAGAYLAVFIYGPAEPTSQIPATVIAATHDVAPGSDRATLTLGDGSTVVLGDSASGPVPQQGSASISQQNGRLAYRVSGENNISVYNTVSTPRGGQYQLVLPDGSRVWLNAASSLRFPTVFTGNSREVELSGEAYFEVARQAARPFRVILNGSKVEVLGTHFNVMAYAEEPSVQTTLLEGAVRLLTPLDTSLLKPGEQWRRSARGTEILRNVDLESVVAWKNGYFLFENAGLETVLRQLARWYDVDIVYTRARGNDLLFADIPRNTRLSDALKALELASGVTFRIDGKTIIVSP